MKTLLTKTLLLIFFASIINSCNQEKKNISSTNNSSVKLQDTFAFYNPSLSLDKRIQDLMSRLTLEEKIGQMMNGTPAIKRLKIPAYDYWNEALHGVGRTCSATIFPQAIGLGATFDKDLAFRVSSVISDEARAIYNATNEKGYNKQYNGTRSLFC